MIENLAVFYVYFIEPAVKMLLVVIGIIFVLWLLILIKDANKAKDLINSAAIFIWRSVAGSLKFVGLFLWAVVMFVVRLVNIAYASIRDFFASKV